MNYRQQIFESPYLLRAQTQKPPLSVTVWNDLVRLRRYLVNGCSNVANAMDYRSLQERYPQALAELLDELHPRGPASGMTTTVS